MTTTMHPHTGLQNSVQSPPQGQVQINPPPDDPSPAQRCPPPPSDADDIDPRAQEKRQKAELCTLAKTFGHIPNVPIFASWDKRVNCSNSAVHRSILAGICGNGRDGAYSVALSSLYKDDEDGGDVIIYTGAGGRKRWSDSNPPKRLRLGPQTMDQSWDHPSNKALKTSSLTENPVRVVRSWKCPSQYAPVMGYRYDGLYKVANCWTATGSNGKNICRCRLERLPDQPPIPLRPITFSTSRRWNREHLVSRPTCSPPLSTDSDIEPKQSNSSLTQLEGSTGRESEGLPNPPQERVPPQRGVFSLNPNALPRYRWDPKKNELVRVPASHPIPDDFDAAEGEDDATLVPSEYGHWHANVPANERMESEYFSAWGNSPRSGTPDASGSSSLGNQGDH